MAMGNIRNAGKVHDVAREVGAVCADHRPCMGAHKPLKVRIIHPALPVRRDKIQLHAPLLLQTVQGAQDGIMLAIRGDHMVSAMDGAVDGNVQSLC